MTTDPDTAALLAGLAEDLRNDGSLRDDPAPFSDAIVRILKAADAVGIEPDTLAANALMHCYAERGIPDEERYAGNLGPDVRVRIEVAPKPDRLAGLTAALAGIKEGVRK